MDNTEQSLVSVAVITYNSSNTIVETLDSIYNQTYPNIELIISDDCSTDNTVEICRQWASTHQERFCRIKIIESSVNTGISANCNRGEDACTGVWCKLLAGDDLLLPECIETYMQYAGDRDDLPCLFSRVQCFSAINGKPIPNYAPFKYDFFSLSREQQLHRLIYDENCIPAASVFINIRLMRKLGIKNDERIPMLEDWPKWINILNAGYHLDFLDIELTRYRVGNGMSTCESNPDAYYSGFLFILLYQYPEWKKRDPVDAFARLKIYLGQDNAKLSKRDERNLRVGRFILNPLYRTIDFLRRTTHN